jgi:Fic/DOC family
VTTATEPTVAPAPVTVPLSPNAVAILKLVTRPIGARTPVGFKLAFLDGYRPNETSYLSVAEKQRLAELSRTSDVAGQPAGTHARYILSRLLIDLSWNSSRLEGNTYSLLDTERLIEAGEAAPGKAPIDAQMILNHKAAIEFLVQNAEDIAFDRSTILNLHALLAENLLPDPLATGRVRRIAVGIGQSVYHPPAMPQILDDYFDQFLASAAAIRNPFEQSLFVMVQLPYLQPFEDVNKRVSRLAANIPLITRNLSPISFVDVPHDTYTRGVVEVYELNRVDLLKDVFLWAYERSAVRYAAIQQIVGEPDPFRLRHRQALRDIVADVIRRCMGKTAAAAHIAAWTKTHLAATDVARFIETAETELLGLHEGNYARYRIRPSEYAAWRAVWEARST